MEEWLLSFNERMKSQGHRVILFLDNATCHPRIDLSNAVSYTHLFTLVCNYDFYFYILVCRIASQQKSADVRDSRSYMFLIL